MIFKRQQEQPVFSKIRNIIWPQMGWWRAIQYYKYRILRLPHSARDISMGMAAGCAVSWTPTFPFHILQCYIFCKIARANFPASLLGTVFGNPWTFPLLFIVSYTVGNFFLGVTGLGEALLFLTGESELFQQDGMIVQKYIPTFVGGYIMAALTFPLFYYSLLYMIRAGRASRKAVQNKVHTIIEHRHERKEEKEKKHKK